MGPRKADTKNYDESQKSARMYFLGTMIVGVVAVLVYMWKFKIIKNKSVTKNAVLDNTSATLGDNNRPMMRMAMSMVRG